MKKRIRNVFCFAILTSALAFSFVQLNIPVVKAFGCPDNPAGLWNCGGCNFVYETSFEIDGITYRRCYYNCWGCPGPGGDPMEIEHDVTVEGG